MEEGAGESGGTVDRVGVVLVIAGQVPQSHLFTGGPAILHHHTGNYYSGLKPEGFFKLN